MKGVNKVEKKEVKKGKGKAQGEAQGEEEEVKESTGVQLASIIIRKLLT